MLGGKEEKPKKGFAAANIVISGDQGQITVPLDETSTLILKAPVERIARHAMDNIGGWLLNAAKEKP